MYSQQQSNCSKSKDDKKSNPANIYLFQVEMETVEKGMKYI